MTITLVGANLISCVTHASSRPGTRFETQLADVIAALVAPSVGAVGEFLPSTEDLIQKKLQLLRRGRIGHLLYGLDRAIADAFAETDRGIRLDGPGQIGQPLAQVVLLRHQFLAESITQRIIH